MSRLRRTLVVLALAGIPACGSCGQNEPPTGDWGDAGRPRMLRTDTDEIDASALRAVRNRRLFRDGGAPDASIE